MHALSRRKFAAVNICFIFIFYREEEELEKKPQVAPKPSSGYDPRPFSYLKPGFRPSDHLALRTMKDNKADIKQALSDDIKEMDKHASESESDAESAFVRGLLTESARKKKASAGQ